MSHTIWKVRRKAGENPDYFSYSIKREGCFPLTLTEEQFEALFPEINVFSVPEAPETATIAIKGTLIL